MESFNIWYFLKKDLTSNCFGVFLIVAVMMQQKIKITAANKIRNLKNKTQNTSICCTSLKLADNCPSEKTRVENVVCIKRKQG